MSSFTASLIDLGLFTLINLQLGSLLPAGSRLLMATAAARVVSAICNYVINHKAVFKSKEAYGKTFIRYAVFACIRMAASYFIVYLLSSAFRKAAVWDTALKVLADLALYFISFHIQRKWIFK